MPENQIQGDPKFSPPSRANIESFYEKLTNTFSTFSQDQKKCKNLTFKSPLNAKKIKN